ncbi:MAG TPA: hypothetical protein VLH79_16190 [Chthonomonadales bacterium]|nr:hypothetical protein [Chthonomonadales bacterium]
MPDIMALSIPLVALCIPIVAIVAAHRRKVLELQLLLRGQADEKVMDELRSLRRDLEGLRDTSTRYDVSFDQALQRVESRVAALERRPASAAPAEPAPLRGSLGEP